MQSRTSAGHEVRRNLDRAGKPQPAVIVQDDRCDATASITICAFTSDETEAPLFRLTVEPTARNGLKAESRLIVDKLTTVSKDKLGKQIGSLGDQNMLRLNRACTYSWVWRDGVEVANPEAA